jgi:hypothetical protein
MLIARLRLAWRIKSERQLANEDVGFQKTPLPTIFICLATAHFAHASQPTYHGKSFSQWLWDAKWERDALARQQDLEAIRHIGTNGVPTLIDLVSINEKNVKKILFKLHNANLTYFYNFNDDKDDSLDGLRDLGVFGFGILGTNAAFAVPQIAKLFDSYDETMFQAGQALATVGSTGFFVLTNAINNTNAGVRDLVIRVIGKDGGCDPEVKRQLLLNALNDQQPIIRLHAADFLQGKEPDSVVPALISVLDDHDCRWRAATLLAVYGSAASSAAPKLFSIFTNQPDKMLLPALRTIDPNTAAKAEEFLVNRGSLGASFGNTTTLLPNGMELIAGGFLQTTIPNKTDHIFSNAVLFDPNTGKWTETGSMNVARYGHTAILLSNGKVLVAGGEDARGNHLSSAELYDPTTGKWTITGSMNTPSGGAKAVLQPDGKVSIPGYYEGDQKKPGDNLYDPDTGAWTVITNK